MVWPAAHPLGCQVRDRAQGRFCDRRPVSVPAGPAPGAPRHRLRRRNIGQGRDLQLPAATMAAQCPAAAAPPRAPRGALQARALGWRCLVLLSHVEPRTVGTLPASALWPHPRALREPGTRLAGTGVALHSPPAARGTLTAQSPGVHGPWEDMEGRWRRRVSSGDRGAGHVMVVTRKDI